MNNGPQPTRLAFLSDLGSLPLNTKVRFLGCVNRYEISTGRLILEHNYPPPLPTTTGSIGDAQKKNPSMFTVPVDINHLLESIRSLDLQVGAWLNVLGYVRAAEPGLQSTSTSTSTSTQHQSARDSSKNGHDDGAAPAIYVEAVMIFSAGAVHIGEYERVLQESLEVDRRIGRPR